MDGMAPRPVLLAGAADLIVGGAAALELEAAELEELGHPIDAHRRRLEAQALAGELEELLEADVAELLVDARRILDTP